MVLLDSNKRDDNFVPHLSTIVARSSSKVLPSGTESSTSPEPIILFRCRIVRTLTVIKSKLTTNCFGIDEIVFLLKAIQGRQRLWLNRVRIAWVEKGQRRETTDPAQYCFRHSPFLRLIQDMQPYHRPPNVFGLPDMYIIILTQSRQGYVLQCLPRCLTCLCIRRIRCRHPLAF